MPTDIYLDDVISRKGDPFGGGITAEKIRSELPDGDDRVRLRINSEGGSVFEAKGILSELKQRGGYDALVDGLAGSAASLLAIEADNLEMSEGSWLMIHNPATFAAGDVHEMRRIVQQLENFTEEYAGAYHSKTGIDREQIAAMMDAETWIGDEEAVAGGWADGIAEKPASKRALAACFRPDGRFPYRNAPQCFVKVTDAQRARVRLNALTSAVDAVD